MGVSKFNLKCILLLNLVSHPVIIWLGVGLMAIRLDLTIRILNKYNVRYVVIVINKLLRRTIY